MTTLMKGYFKNFSWMMLDNAIKITLGITVSVYVTRYLGPHDYGVLSYALSITGVISPFATLGIDAILLRNIISDKSRAKSYLHTARILKLVAGTVLFIVVIIVAYLSKQNIQLIYILGILMFGVVINSFNVYKEFVIAVDKIRYTAFASIYSLIGANISRLIMIFAKVSVIWFSVAVVIGQIVNIIGLRYFYKKESKSGSNSFDMTIAKSLLSDSWPLVFTSFTGLLYIYADQIIIEYYFNFKMVGIYSSAVKLILFFIVIPSILSNMIYPKIIQFYKSLERKEFIRKMDAIYFFNLLLASIICTFFILIGDWLIIFLYGIEFAEASIILKIYSISLIFSFFNANNNKLLMLDNLQKIMLVRNSFGLLVNLVLNFLLIPIIGIKGAALATIGSQLVIMFSYVMNSRIKYILGIQLRAFIFPFILVKEKII
jgi:O-antigen/teichoic acid export membrane protein